MRSLAQGFSASQILQYIIRQFPQHAQKINTAMAAGYSAEKILQSLSKDKKNSVELEKTLTEHEKSRLYTEQHKKKMLKNTALTAAALAGAAGFAASGGMNGLNNVLSGNIMPQNPPTMPNTPQTTSMGPQNSITGPQTPTQTMPPQPMAPQPQNSPTGLTPPQALPAKIPSAQALQNMNQLQRVQNMISAGNDNDTIATFLNTQIKGAERKAFGESLKKGEVKPLLDMVEDIRQEMGNKVLPKNTESDIKESELSPHNLSSGAEEMIPPQHFPKEERQNPKKETPLPLPEKNEEADTPQGIGTIRELGPVNALVEIDGKLHKIPISELKPSKEEIRKAEIVFDPKKVPEDMRSAALGIVHTSPDKTKIYVMFGPSGKFYTYRKKSGQKFSEDELEKIRSGSTLPITSGDTWMGAWNSDDPDSRGAHVQAELVKKSHKPDKPDDPNKDLIVEESETLFTHGYIKSIFEAFEQMVRMYAKKEKKPK